jgi:hypothetical protein
MERYPGVDLLNRSVYYDLPIRTVKARYAVFASDRPVCPDGHQHNLFTMPGVDILAHSKFGGPLALTEYSAVVYIPYQFSTISLQEYLSIGLFVFVPSPELTKQCRGENLAIEYMDVYTGPLINLITYYDNYDQLAYYIKEINLLNKDKVRLEELKEARKAAMRDFDDDVFDEWQRYLLPYDYDNSGDSDSEGGNDFPNSVRI